MRTMLKKAVAFALAAVMMIPAMGISASAASEPFKSGVLGVEDVELTQGTKGDKQTAEYTINSDASSDILDLFGLTAGEKVSLTKANAIDNGTNGEWRGNVKAAVSVPTTGKYCVSILGETGNVPRNYKVTVNGNDYETNAGDTLVGTANLRYYSVDVDLTAGDNTLTITGGSGLDNSAPNFIYLVVTEIIKTNGLGSVLDVEDVELTQGTKGDKQTAEYTINSDASSDILDLFGLTAGEKVSLTKANAIDNGTNGEWRGNVKATVSVPTTGKYRVSLLGETGDLGRNYKITANDSDYETNAGDTLVGKSNLRYYSVDVDLTAGDNVLTITGGSGVSGGAAPNFIYLVVTEVPAATVTWVTDTDAAVADGKGTIRFLAQYTTDAAVDNAAFALVKNDGTIEFAFTPAAATAFYADVTDIPEAAFGKTCTAVPYVTIDGEAVVGDSISASVNVAE